MERFLSILGLLGLLAMTAGLLGVIALPASVIIGYPLCLTWAGKVAIVFVCGAGLVLLSGAAE